MNILREGKDVTFYYDITGIGHTYKYGAVDGFQYNNGPYWMEVVDDVLYVNGLGDDGKTNARLQPDDFHFKTFTMRVKHKDVTAVSLNGDVKTSTQHLIKDRVPVEVYVMTEDQPDVWQLDQYVSLPEYENYDTYVDENGNETFKFKKDKVYRIKFVYKEANGDIELVSTVGGVLRGSGSTVKEVIKNIDKQHIENFQLFNWDAQMGYDKNGNWENPTDGRTITGTTDWMKADMLALDAQLYSGHSNEEGNVKIATRLHAQNNIKDYSSICGASKRSSGISQYNKRLTGHYYITALNGRASSPDDLRALVESGVIPDTKTMVYHELLPMGMTLDSSLEKPVYAYSGRVSFTTTPTSYPSQTLSLDEDMDAEVSYVVTNNYKGSLRQMVDITVTYPDLPIMNIGYDDDCYALGSIIQLHTRGEYADIITTTLDNYVAVQFIDDSGKPVELDGPGAKLDDGEYYSNVKGRDGSNALSDVDGDNDTTKKTVVAATASDTIDVVYSDTQLYKKIRADDYDAYFKDFTQTYAGHNYTYQIKFFSTQGESKNIVIFDPIEEGYNEEEYKDLPYWKGTLYGVDLREARDKGFNKIRVFVNTTKFYPHSEIDTDYINGYEGLQPKDLTAANGWQEVNPDTYTGWANVKTIAFSIGEDVSFGESDELPKSVSVYLKMKAPDTIHPQQTPTQQVLAYNVPSYYSEKKVIGTNDWSKDTTTAKVVTIGLKSATVDLPAITKRMTGSDLPLGFEDTCTFNIKPLGESVVPREYDKDSGVWGNTISSVDVKVNSTSAVATEYGSIFFTEPGENTYEISEKQGSKPGVTYSKAKYRMDISITDERKDIQYDPDTILKHTQTIYKTHDDDGTELAKPQKVTSIVFNNEYKVKPVAYTVPVSYKKITGAARPEEKEFTFGFAPFTMAGGKTPPAPERPFVTVTGEGSASMGNITFTQAGNYEFVIAEVGSAQKGYTYDTHGFWVLVAVSDVNGELKITNTAMYRLDPDEMVPEPVQKIEFVNDYLPHPSNAVSFPDVYKAFSGDTRPAEKDFSFTLTAKDGAPVPSKTKLTITGAGKDSFGAVSFSKAGTYVYEITEDDLDPSYTGYTKDSTVYTYTVTVTDTGGELDATGKLTKNGVDAAAATFENNYTPVASEVDVPLAVKVITGADRPVEKPFTFEIKPGTDGIPMPENTTATVTGAGTASAFGKINYDKAGTYTYTIFERDLDDSYVGYTKDESVYTYTVTVTDDNGTLKASGALTLNDAAADTLVFTNDYTPNPSNAVTFPEVNKQFSGQTRPAEKTFSFTLTAKEGAPVPTKTKVTVTGEGKAAFDEMTFTKAGTYVYEITEDDLDTGFVGYTKDDSVYTFTVTVTDNDGNLEAQGKLTKSGNDADEVIFVNDYTPVAAEHNIPLAVKEIKGADRPAEKLFTFEIKPSTDGIPMPENTTATITGAGTASAFGKIVYDKAGTYTYTIFERDLDKETYYGYTKDESVYTYTVTVKDNDGTLEAEGKLTKTDGDENSLTFVNSYTPDSTSITVPAAVKKIEGVLRPAEKKLSFEIKTVGGDDQPLPEKTIVSVTGEGETDAFGTITYDKAGTYQYSIFESDLDSSYVGYTKDESVYVLTVTVTDEGGKLKAEYVLTKDSEACETPEFVNKYTPNSVETDLEVEKKITGAAPDAKETFRFVLTAADGTPLPESTTVEITGEGKKAFGKWTYTEVRTYVYKVTETAGSNSDCEYDKTVYTITDTVTDVDGALKISRKITAADSEAQSVVFTNNYKETPKETPKDTPTPSNPTTGHSEFPHTSFGAVILIAAALCVLRSRKSEDESDDL